VTQLKQFGAFVQVTENVEGMIHVGDIVNEKRINHPQDELKVGQIVHAVVLENDREKRRLRLGLKQLVPTSLDEYIAEHKDGDEVTGRCCPRSLAIAQRWSSCEGVQGHCTLAVEEQKRESRNPDRWMCRRCLRCWRAVEGRERRGGSAARRASIRDRSAKA